MKNPTKKIASRAERIARREAVSLNKRILKDISELDSVYEYSFQLDRLVVEAVLDVLVFGAVTGISSLPPEISLSFDKEILNIVDQTDYNVMKIYFEEAAVTLSQSLRLNLGKTLFNYSKQVQENNYDPKRAATFLREYFKAHGYSLRTANNLKTLFTTGFYLSFNGMRYSRTRKSPVVWGYRYTNPDDEKSRENHAAQNNVTLPKEHSFWQTWLPPNGYNCRCGIEVLYDRANEVLPNSDFSPDPGFDLNIFSSIRGF